MISIYTILFIYLFIFDTTSQQKPQQAIKKLKKLKKLNLSNKRLKKVPRWVKYFSGTRAPLLCVIVPCISLPVAALCTQGVERLDLSHNELTYLPTYLGHFGNLKKLLLDANPLESIPAEIRKGKLSGLLSYLRVHPHASPVCVLLLICIFF